jgi:hypothetical protein
VEGSAVRPSAFSNPSFEAIPYEPSPPNQALTQQPAFATNLASFERRKRPDIRLCFVSSGSQARMSQNSVWLCGSPRAAMMCRRRSWNRDTRARWPTSRLHYSRYPMRGFSTMMTSGHPIGWSRSTSMVSRLPCISQFRDGSPSLPGSETGRRSYFIASTNSAGRRIRVSPHGSRTSKSSSLLTITFASHSKARPRN